eukprot:1046537-Rhodomonas_salina.1
MEYLIVGAFEYCPPGFEPLCICGMGLVCKKTHPFWRLIIDFQPVIDPGAVCWSLDISLAKGYLANVIGGCNAGLHGGFVDGDPSKRFKTKHKERYWVGCTPETCKKACSKALTGVWWRGQVYHMACGWFGTRHCGNILAAIMQQLVDEIKSRFGIAVLIWVDDILCICPNVDPTHDLRDCWGRGVCSQCTQTYENAKKIEALVDDLITQLGLLTNEKDEPCSQVGEFTGLHWDTIHSVFFLTQAKARSLGDKAAELLANPRVMQREVAQFRGLLFWYGPCIPGVKVLTRGLNAYIGAMPDDMWDKHKPLDEDACDELQFLVDTLPALAEIAKPMVAPAPSDLLQQFVLGHP